VNPVAQTACITLTCVTAAPPLFASDVRFRGKADIAQTYCDVCF